MESFQVIEVDEGINQAVLSGLSCWRELRGGGAAEHPALLAVSPKASTLTSMETTMVSLCNV